MSSGKLIEQLTSIIEDTLQGDEKVKVTHDTFLTDDSGNKRQIDVLIEYVMNDRFTFKTIIECKEKGRDRVEINQMNAFIETVNSLPQVHKAIFLSTKGFQKGAINRAEKNGILLYTLEDIKKDDFKKSVLIPKMRNVLKRFEVVDWRLMLKEEDKDIIKNKELEITPSEYLQKANGENIKIDTIISAIVPFRANQLHNHLFDASIKGHDVFKEKYVNISYFPLNDGIFLSRENLRIPISYIEIKIQFWLEIEDVEQTVHKLYKDQEGKVVADVVFSKVDYSGKEVYLSVVDDKNNSQKGIYLVDGKKKQIKLTPKTVIEVPEKNLTSIIVENPYSNKEFFE